MNDFEIIEKVTSSTSFGELIGILNEIETAIRENEFDYTCEFDNKFGLELERKMAEIEIALENRGFDDEG